VPAASGCANVKLVCDPLTRLSFTVGAGGLVVPKCRRYLSVPAAADQVNVGVALAVLLSAGPIRLNDPGALQVVAAVLNDAQLLVGDGQFVLDFFATTRHS
jgi:hypothetical protein